MSSSGSVTYSDLVREAFIDPLRSVLIVDDQYPTWGELIAGSESASKQWKRNPARLKGLIDTFKTNSPRLIIDIHDANDSGLVGGESAEVLAEHLHQSDLLVLDYNLEGAESGLGGAIARKYLRSILNNVHFNLVVVHTDEADLRRVHGECCISLLTKLSDSWGVGVIADLEAASTYLDGLLDSGDVDVNKYHEFMAVDEYLGIIQEIGVDGIERLGRNFSQGGSILPHLRAELLGDNFERRHFRGLFYWLIENFEKKNEDLFIGGVEGLVEWGQRSSSPLWLRSSKGFVVFTSKDSTDLVGVVQEALESWKPDPSRLLLSKYRHALSASGVDAEDRVLSSKEAYAYFYKSIKEGYERTSGFEGLDVLMKEYIGLQNEKVSSHLDSAVIEYCKKIVCSDSGDYLGYYGVDFGNSDSLPLHSYNSYISSLPVSAESDQLATGHIFKLNDGWWVCATPACDMQRGQNTIAFVGSSDQLRPFTALKLVEIDFNKLNSEHINSGEYCFVEVDGKVKVLGLTDIVGGDDCACGGASAGIINTNKVTWRTFVAKNAGEVVGRKLTIITPKLNQSTIDLTEYEAQVYVKLRYEYALNYIQKVSTSVSRIGLGYSSN